MPWRVHNQKWFLYFLNRKQNLHRMQILCKSPDLHGVQDVDELAGVVPVLLADGPNLIYPLLGHTYLFHTLWLLFLGIGGTWFYDRLAVIVTGVEKFVREVPAGFSQEVPVEGLDVGILV